ncbi:MAG: ABC transporter ATP-binding protein [Candidatus Sumerlaeaceae bacterium]
MNRTVSAHSTSQACLVADEVSFSYDGKRCVVERVSFDLKAGEFLGLIGPNGAGKSTLLRVLSGSLAPTAGHVLLNGHNLYRLAKYQIAQQISFVPQKTASVFPFRVIEMVLMGRQPYAGFALFEDEHDLEIVENALERTGIKHLRNKFFHELSGGEQQLVVLARALAQETRILVLDEPVTFLDLRHQWEILCILRELVEQGAAVLATFHDLNAAARWCTEVALMVRGSLVAKGNAQDVLREHILWEAYGLRVRVEKRTGGEVRVELP